MRTAHASFRASSRAPLSVRAAAESATKTVVRKAKAPPREGNVEGPFWIDETCINCDLCRRMGPSTYSQLGDGSVVYAQPTTKKERVDALQALLSCPTNSIHADSFDKAELREAQQGMPRPIPNCPGVYHCGWHSEKSFSAASYFIQRPEGNILIDSPRWNPILLKKLEEMGGVSVMFLTHKDDMADHDKWAAHFKCPRIMHQRDFEGINPTIEVVLQGDGPWDLNGKPIKESEIPTTSGNNNGGEAREITLIYTPGHTKGHVCLLYEPTKTLFSGDHLSQDGQHLDASPEGELHIFKDFNWFSVAKQFRSVEKLRRYDFMTVLPGHGRILQFRDAEHRARAFDDFLSNQDNQRSSM